MYNRIFRHIAAGLTTRTATSIHNNKMKITQKKYNHHDSINRVVFQNMPHTAQLTQSVLRNQQRFMSLRDKINERLKKDAKKHNKLFVERQEQLSRRGKEVLALQQQAKIDKNVKILQTLHPDGAIQPYDPRIVAISPDSVPAVAKTSGEIAKKESKGLLGKFDSKFGGSFHVGRLNLWQGSLILALIIGMIYAGRKFEEKTVQLPQKKMAVPMIDFVRTSTLIKYMWTLRLMLEVGALVPYDGTEDMENDLALREQIEGDLAEESQRPFADTRKDTELIHKLGHHPQIIRNQNFVAALGLIDHELHKLDRELRESLLDLMEIFAQLGQPYESSYIQNLNNLDSVDALYLHNSLQLLTDMDPDHALKTHELMKDALQVLFTRQNSAHRHYGQMFSDIYALTWLKSGIFALPEHDRKAIPDELQYYIHNIGYDIVRVWQDNFVHELHKKLSRHLYRLAVPAEIIDFSLVTDQRAEAIEPFVRELRKIDQQVIADYTDFIDYHQTISKTKVYKNWWQQMTSHAPRFRRARQPQPPITISNYTQLFQQYEKIFGKVPYLAMLSKEVGFLEKLKDLSLGNTVDFDGAAHVIADMQTTSNLHKILNLSEYSIEAVVEETTTKLREVLDKEFQDRLSRMSYIDEATELKMIQDHEKNVEKKTKQLKKHQHTLSLLKIPPTLYTTYLYNLLDISSPMLQVIKDQMEIMQQNDIYFPMLPCMGSFRGIYHDISHSAQVLCQRDSNLVSLKSQLGDIYRKLDDTEYELSNEMKQRLIAREKELLAVPDVREYALSMTRDEIARDERFIHGKSGGLFDLDDEKKKLNVFGDREDDLNPNHPINKGERGKILSLTSIPDPPRHLANSIWMMDSYVDVRPGRPDHGEDRRSFLAKKFNALRSFMPIPTRYVPQSVQEALRRQDEINQERIIQEKNRRDQKIQQLKKTGDVVYDEHGNAFANANEGAAIATLAQRQARKYEHNKIFEDRTLYENLTKEEMDELHKNKLQRLHAIAGANLAKLETCITQDLVELNNWGIDIKMPLTNLKPSQFKHLIQPPYSTIEREVISPDRLRLLNHGKSDIPGSETGMGHPGSSGSINGQAMTFLVINGKEKLMDKYRADLIDKVHILGGNMVEQLNKGVYFDKRGNAVTNTLGERQAHTQLILERQRTSGKMNNIDNDDIISNTTTTTPNRAAESKLAQSAPTISAVAESGLRPSQFYKQHSQTNAALQRFEFQEQQTQTQLGQKPEGQVYTNDKLINLNRLDDAQIVLPFSAALDEDGNYITPRTGVDDYDVTEMIDGLSQRKKSTTKQSKQKEMDEGEFDIIANEQQKMRNSENRAMEERTSASLSLTVPIPDVDADNKKSKQKQLEDPIQHVYKTVKTHPQVEGVVDVKPIEPITPSDIERELKKQQKQQELVLQGIASRRSVDGSAPVANLDFNKIETISTSKYKHKQPLSQQQLESGYQYDETYADDNNNDNDDDANDEYDDDEYSIPKESVTKDPGTQTWAEYLWGGK